MPEDKPEFIRLMSANGLTVLDSVASEYEDSFCLESFGDSIRTAEEVEPKGKKKFIIARVQTWDHKQPDRAFYSYYHAHHLNKMLFQTQVYLEKKLIHRLHVLNPLTNTDIIGNVLYFMVIGKSKKTDGRFKRLSASDDLQLKEEIQTAALAVPPSPSVSKIFAFSDPVLLNRAIHNHAAETIQEEDEAEEEAPSDGNRPISKESKKSLADSPNAAANEGWTMTGPKTIVEGIVTPSTTKSVSPTKRNSITAAAVAVGRRLSSVGRSGFQALEGGGDEEKGQANNNNDQGFKKAVPKGVKTLRVTTDFNSGTQSPMSAGVLDTRSGDFKSDANAAVYPMTAHPGHAARYSVGSHDGLLTPNALEHAKKASIPAGTLSRNGEKLTPLQAISVVPNSARSRRRSLSYMNSLVTSGAVGATIEDWKDMIREDRLTHSSDKNTVQLEVAAGKFDQVKPFGYKDLKSPLIQQVEAVSTVEEYYYDAILIATDNDFLETSRVRAIFRENAVNPSDAVLFEMPAYTGEQQTNRGPNNGNDVPLPCDCCFPSEQQLRDSPAALRLLHELKCYILVIGLTVALVIFIALALSNVK